MQIKTILGAATACAIALAATPASAANTFPVAGGPFFGGPLDGGGTATFTASDAFAAVVTASLGRNDVAQGTGYSDSFTFTLPNNGTGSGSVSTSFVELFNMSGVLVFSSELNFTSVTFDNGTDVIPLSIISTAAGQSVTATDIPIFAGALNSLTFDYDVIGTIGSYGGNATFVAVPEPGTWALMLLGFAGIGLAMRRRRKEEVRVKYAF